MGKNKVSKKDKTKGLVFIIIGLIVSFVFYFSIIIEVSLGGSLIIMIIGVWLILEGSAIRRGKRKGKKSKLFNP